MIIEKKEYAIATKSFPMKFCDYDEDYDYVDSIELAYLDTLEIQEEKLSKLSYPDEHQILEVKISYEF